MSRAIDIGTGAGENFKIGASNLEFHHPENLPVRKNFPPAADAGFAPCYKARSGAVIFRIVGKRGVARTSRISELLKALPPEAFLSFDLDDGCAEPEVRS